MIIFCTDPTGSCQSSPKATCSLGKLFKIALAVMIGAAEAQHKRLLNSFIKTSKTRKTGRRSAGETMTILVADRAGRNRVNLYRMFVAAQPAEKSGAYGALRLDSGG